MQPLQATVYKKCTRNLHTAAAAVAVVVVSHCLVYRNRLKNSMCQGRIHQCDTNIVLEVYSKCTANSHTAAYSSCCCFVLLNCLVCSNIQNQHAHQGSFTCCKSSQEVHNKLSHIISSSGC
jgi:hypothetical protein